MTPIVSENNQISTPAEYARGESETQLDPSWRQIDGNWFLDKEGLGIRVILRKGHANQIRTVPDRWYIQWANNCRDCCCDFFVGDSGNLDSVRLAAQWNLDNVLRVLKKHEADAAVFGDMVSWIFRSLPHDPQVLRPTREGDPWQIIYGHPELTATFENDGVHSLCHGNLWHSENIGDFCKFAEKCAEFDEWLRIRRSKTPVMNHERIAKKAKND